MDCRQARQKLTDCNWIVSPESGDTELLAHLESCPQCRALARAENAISSDLTLLRGSQPDSDISMESLRETVANASISGIYGHHKTANKKIPSAGFRFLVVKRYALAIAIVAFLILAFVPFNFREKIGYEITIGGVDKDIVAENQDITPLLQALGMQQDLATNLLDSLGTDRARLYIGECRETCFLRISDLKTERDVKLVVKAIIELGCCQIEKIAPIFRDETSSLLKYAAKKLYS
jgi:hypothetical protein